MTGGTEQDLGLDPEALARAEAAVAALSARYLRWVRGDLAALGTALAALRQAGPEHWRDAAERVHALAHDIKGQGATFGYPLLSHLGQTMCLSVRALCWAELDALARLDALAAAMAEIIAHGLAGDGGAHGRALLDRLGLTPPGIG